MGDRRQSHRQADCFHQPEPIVCIHISIGSESIAFMTLGSRGAYYSV